MVHKLQQQWHDGYRLKLKNPPLQRLPLRIYSRKKNLKRLVPAILLICWLKWAKELTQMDCERTPLCGACMEVSVLNMQVTRADSLRSKSIEQSDLRTRRYAHCQNMRQQNNHIKSIKYSYCKQLWS